MTSAIPSIRRNACRAIVLILFMHGSVWAQEQLPSLNSVRTPNSPAFSILGIQPTSVERPNTPSDLAISLDNATAGFTKFPENYAIEFAPFWLSKKAARLTWQEDTLRDIENSLLRTFSISAATISKDMQKKTIRGVSYGFRAFLLSGHASGKSIRRLEKQLEKESEAYATTGEVPTRSDDITLQREGLIVELAVAGSYMNDTVNTKLRKSGYAFWVTPSYVTQDWSFVGVYRFVKDSVNRESQELGFRVIFSRDRYALSVEYLKGKYKTETSLPDRERFSLLFEYKLSDKIWLNLSAGDDNKNIQGTTNLFSSLGLRYNISRQRGG